MRVLSALCLLLLHGIVQAQIGLPALHVPPLPTGLPAGPERAPGSLDERFGTHALQDLRRLRIRDLIRRNPRVIEADARGAAIVRGEILAFEPSAGDLERAAAASFTLVRMRELAGLQTRMAVLHAPPDMPTARALERLQALLPELRVDFNHIYGTSGAGAAAALPAQQPGMAERAADRPVPAAGDVKIGLIDGGVDATHPVFRNGIIHPYGCGTAPVPDEHGTAVASLLVGASGAFRGAIPGAQLYAVDVYCGQPTGGAIDAVLDALAWLARSGVPVINLSLVGPPNTLLEAVVKRVLARGIILVAAVGNDGPAAPPLYPASYPGVVGVTAVDAQRRVLLEAARGPQVRFAAPGADMAAAGRGRTFQPVRGTSFAAPLVAGLLARRLESADVSGAQRALEELTRTAIDLGAPGPDPIYGAGLVGADLAPAATLARAAR